NFLVGGKRDSVGRFELFSEELQLPIAPAIHALKGQFLLGIVTALAQAVWRIREIERAIGFVYQVVGAVQALSLIFIGQRGAFAVFFYTHNAMIAMLAIRHASLLIQG